MNEHVKEPIQLTKEQRFWLVLPLLVLPFTTLLFFVIKNWAANEVSEKKTLTELNTTLPDAVTTNDSLDKMAMYDQSIKDSLKTEDDPFDQFLMKDSAAINSQENAPADFAGGAAKANEQKVYEKLNTLHASLNQQQENSAYSQSPKAVISSEPAIESQEIDRLEQMMRNMKSGEPDQEMEQLNGMLGQILDIQHPERMKERMKRMSELQKGQVFPVSTRKENTFISTLDSGGSNKESKGFYSMSTPQENQGQDNAISAVVHGSQSVVAGSTIKLRLLSDIYINGVLVPKDQFIFGTVSIDGERLTISIDNIRYRQSLFPVKLTVHDLDGMEGIHVPGAISRDVAKESTDQTLQGISLNSLDPSLGAQAMSAGIEATKSFLGRKVKLIKVFIKSGYRVILKDGNQNN